MNIHDSVDLHLEDVEDYSADYPTNDVGYPNAENNMAPAGTSEEYVSRNSVSYRRAAFIALVRNNKWAFGVFGVVFIVLISAIASAGGASRSAQYGSGNDDDDYYGIGVVPIEMHKSDADPEVLAEFKTTMIATYERHGLDKNLLDEITPQRQALLWMASDNGVNEIEHTEKLQRFVLAALFYNTNMVPSVHVEDPRAWKVATNWMSEANSCDWMGVECNDEGNIIAIYLEGNRLSGGIPADLKIIANKIETLDFTDNIMHMRDDDFEVFNSLTNLKTLLMDDNFLYHDKGLPAQFASMVNLEKLRLSYNVFEGELDSEAPVLGSMTKLTHLEMESNYFNGTMPAAVSEMENLTYLYLRRNNMKFNLNFMKEAKFTENMFAMWLDDNEVGGTIPYQIGQYSSLASLSISKANLKGAIPTQIGNLQELRRLWLFDNKLTGTIPDELNNLNLLEVVELHGNKLNGDMPEGVCAAVKSADYDYKSLTSDCKSAVTCKKNCCTQCY
mmetsp:Transcript_11818/g.24415  ORF Transcript_11818/g.24415 Transcript_11818/m.24415 type:complete len:502 (-) Transcript_11818:104-1609(-)